MLFLITSFSDLTRALASTMAPFLSKHLTTSTCPALAAMCNAVSPRCTQHTASYQSAGSTHILSKYLTRHNYLRMRYHIISLLSLSDWLMCHHSQCCWHLARLRSGAAAARCSGDPWRLPHGWESNQTGDRRRGKGGTIGSNIMYNIERFHVLVRKKVHDVIWQFIVISGQQELATE